MNAVLMKDVCTWQPNDTISNLVADIVQVRKERRRGERKGERDVMYEHVCECATD